MVLLPPRRQTARAEDKNAESEGAIERMGNLTCVHIIALNSSNMIYTVQCSHQVTENQANLLVTIIKVLQQQLSSKLMKWKLLNT
jgi:hypothetical protein